MNVFVLFIQVLDKQSGLVSRHCGLEVDRAQYWRSGDSVLVLVGQFTIMNQRVRFAVHPTGVYYNDLSRGHLHTTASLYVASVLGSITVT